MSPVAFLCGTEKYNVGLNAQIGLSNTMEVNGDHGCQAIYIRFPLIKTYFKLLYLFFLYVKLYDLGRSVIWC